MAVLKSERLKTLKAKVKAEMLRRSKTGSVAAYGGADYDYSVAPGPGTVTQQEHLDKLSIPMSAVNADAVPRKTGPRVVTEEELANMETRVTVWAARTLTDRSASDCKAGCTGTCYTGCVTGCSGCGSGCPNGCSGCGSGCPNGCSGCGSGCPNGCSGCGSGCGSGCSGGCSDNCASGCPTGCQGGCSSNCASGCPAGCSIGCGNGCGTECSTGCSGCGSGCGDSCTATCGHIMVSA